MSETIARRGMGGVTNQFFATLLRRSMPRRMKFGVAVLRLPQ